jgi:hypothetical protein
MIDCFIYLTVILIFTNNSNNLFFQKPAADIKGPLFSVLFNVLLYNWRHFFRSSAVRTLMGGGTSGHQDQVLHQSHFLGIMQAFGQSFLQPDIAIFKQNLEALESLNSKWKLYQKVTEISSILLSFISSQYPKFDR